MNSLPALVFFDSGSSRSFVSQSSSREFGVPEGKLDCPLRVSIANEHGVSASSIYRGCELKIFGVSFPIDLIPIPMGDVCMIVGMDWLNRFGAMIDCEGQRMVVRTPSGGELVVYGEGTRIGLGFCSAARARQYIQHGCADFHASQGSDFSFRGSRSQRVCRRVSGGVARDTSGEAGRV